MLQLPPLDEYVATIEGLVGPGPFTRGRRYFEEGRVRALEWLPEDSLLSGRVEGNGPVLYDTTAYFDMLDHPPSFLGGDCTCPVGFECKHVVAISLAAADFLVAESSDRARIPDAAWDRVLSGAIAAASADSGSGTTPLALRLCPASPTGTGDTHRGLFLRLMRPGKRGNWINGSLSWRNIDVLGPEYPRAQVRALTELFRACEAEDYSCAWSTRDLDLSEVGGVAVWDSLARVHAAGVQFIHAWGPAAPVAEPLPAEVAIDVTEEQDGGRRLRPVVRVNDGHGIDGTGHGGPGDGHGGPGDGHGGPGDGHGGDGDHDHDHDHDHVVPLTRFVPLGIPPHGLFALVSPDQAHLPLARTTAPSVPPEKCAIRLLRLTEAPSDGLTDLLGAGDGLTVPPEETERFTREFAPVLGRIAGIVSSDSSFAIPDVHPPRLELHARFPTVQRLDLSWAWAYRIAGEVHRFPLDDARAVPMRDAMAEAALLAELCAQVRFQDFRMRRLPGGPLLPSVSLDGPETLRAATELLPLLRSRDDVDVVIDGDAPDFRDVGDTLRIGVSADADGSGATDWFSLGITVTVDGTEIPLAVLISAIARDAGHLVLDDGRYLPLDKPELRALRTLIEEARALQGTPEGELRISRYQLGLWEELAELGVVERQAEAWKRQVQGLRELGEPDAAVPTGLEADLRPYQLDGYRWLEFLWRNRLGGILADDMGLGKTLQALALLCSAREGSADDGPGPSLTDGATPPPALILAPSSVVPNWAFEAQRFAPGLEVRVLAETSRKRGIPVAEATGDADVVVTSYTLFRLDYEEFDALDWQLLLMDEAQFAKNHQSKLYQCARRLGAPVKIAITGTPMENNLMELWSLLSITAPGLFPHPGRFIEFYRKPIERDGDEELLARLRRRVRPLMLRRTKEQVVRDLPDKQEQVLEIPLSPQHRRMYDTYLKREQQKILGLLDDVDKNRFEIFRSLTMLRQLSLDPSLVDPESAIPSAKVDALLEHLSELTAGGHKALVFSQFTGFLRRVRGRLDAAGIPYSYLDGSTSRRAEVISGFTSGATDVFLISLKAGGFGLNLTEADYCFILDPWWNPATEAQAVDRAHRIGQTRNVLVYRMISADTIEDKVMELKARKAELVSGVLDGGGGMSSALDAADIRALLA